MNAENKRKALAEAKKNIQEESFLNFRYHERKFITMIYEFEIEPINRQCCQLAVNKGNGFTKEEIQKVKKGIAEWNELHRKADILR